MKRAGVHRAADVANEAGAVRAGRGQANDRHRRSDLLHTLVHRRHVGAGIRAVRRNAAPAAVVVIDFVRTFERENARGANARHCGVDVGLVRIRSRDPLVVAEVGRLRDEDELHARRDELLHHAPVAVVGARVHIDRETVANEAEAARLDGRNRRVDVVAVGEQIPIVEVRRDADRAHELVGPHRSNGRAGAGAWRRDGRLGDATGVGDRGPRHFAVRRRDFDVRRALGSAEDHARRRDVEDRRCSCCDTRASRSRSRRRQHCRPWRRAGRACCSRPSPDSA